jgi:hypothetical protein
MNHKAIYALYPQTVTVDDGTGAFDADGNQVTIDMDAVNAWVDPDAYKDQRAKAYPSLNDQADMAYWDRQNGTTTLDDAILAVKVAYPKPVGVI